MNVHRLLAAGLGVLSLALVPAAVRGRDGGSEGTPTSLPGADQDKDIKALAARIDQKLAAAWGKDVVPAALADDAEFFRRVHLDLAGRIPSVTEVRDFLDDDRPDKRRIWVERILAGEADDSSYRDAHANHFANVWRASLMAQTNQQALLQQPALEQWLRQRLKANVGYDQLVRDLLTQSTAGNPGVPVALGGQGDGSPAAFFQANEFRPENLAGSTARLFLGVSLECAQCHNHPFAEWTRDQFWEYAAFFSDVPQPGRPGQAATGRIAPLPRGQIKIMGTDKVATARFLDGAEPQWKDSGTRTTLAAWMTSPENPYFAKAAVNRMWAYFFGTALVGQSEAGGSEGPPGHAELLDELARSFAAHNFDTKFLIRAITASEAYQRTSAVSHPSHKNTRLFARMPLRGLTPEQLFDSLATATEYQEVGAADPLLVVRGGGGSPRQQFLAKFPGQEDRTDYQTSILQALYLMNNEFIADRVSVKSNRTLATLASQKSSTARKVESLYLVVLGRKPRPAESERFVKYVGSGDDAGKALADVFWVLLNSPEFLLNH